MSFLITNAFADTAAAGAQTGAQGLLSFLPMLVIFGLFMYLMIIRPQQKRAKDHRDLISKMQKDDEVITVGGIIGKIEKLSDEYITLSIANGVNINVQKSAISSVLPKGTMSGI